MEDLYNRCIYNFVDDIAALHYKERLDEIEEQEKDLARRLYNRRFSSKEREEMKSASQWKLRFMDKIRVEIWLGEGELFQCCLPTRLYKRFPRNGKGYVFRMHKDTEWGKECLELEAKRERLEWDRDNFAASLYKEAEILVKK